MTDRETSSAIEEPSDRTPLERAVAQLHDAARLLTQIASNGGPLSGNAMEMARRCIVEGDLASVVAKALRANPSSERDTALPSIEAVSATVHAAWIASKLAQDVTSRKAEDGEELMVPYEQLSEKAKELDRATVRAVYAAIKACDTPPSMEFMDDTKREDLTDDLAAAVTILKAHPTHAWLAESVREAAGYLNHPEWWVRPTTGTRTEEAWQAFRQANGYPDTEKFRQIYMASSEEGARLGCLILEARVKELTEQLAAMTGARDYEKAAHQRTIDYHASRSTETPRIVLEWLEKAMCGTLEDHEYNAAAEYIERATRSAIEDRTK